MRSAGPEKLVRGGSPCASRGDGFDSSSASSPSLRSRGDGSSRTGASPKSLRGFTLIEILLATVLLAAGLALGFATLRAATATVQRGEVLARDSERMRAVSAFLRSRLTAALPMAFGQDEQTGAPLRFVGEADRMRFVSQLPDYLGRGGPALHDVAVQRERDGLRLVVSFASVVGGATFEERPARPPEPLAEGLDAVRFAYRGLDAEGKPTAWLDRWDGADDLPLQVRVEITGRQGATWPTLLVALPQGSGRMQDPAGLVP
ncbi:prepilin-type N-terminal cleavage/methylation domain-containing protein [Luteimonas yindakuii]|uniref:prepilin-type N-terminal cleavage/methylation domain-containing protein n=1 Tax=Luteimonas yindakuii TaxID=2565782 RepID=UPI0010A50CFD|nr:prepilin-type N-terminal cleavage/methylation domain-containing protein [Luteimonas yindakuii]QCO68411.1 prepilin-type N-terminal cleavage/methylation domain-containing protein [Luteimonas yindakuii]